MRIFRISLLFMLSILSISAFSSTSYHMNTFAPWVITLPPNDPQVVVNPLPWKVKGTCEVVSESSKNPLSFTMLSSKGTFNGVELPQGESFYLIAHPGERYELSAEIRAKIEIVNHGTNTMKIVCVN